MSQNGQTQQQADAGRTAPNERCQIAPQTQAYSIPSAFRMTNGLIEKRNLRPGLDSRSLLLKAGAGKTYKPPTLVMFSGATQSGCGFAKAAMGPFYCPIDQKVYLDTSFFQDLERRFRACDVGSKSCQFSEAYVIAHEIGHHVQNLLGLLPKVQEAQRGMEKAEANSLQVRVELQADCLRTVTQTPATSGAGVALPIFEPILQAIWALEIAPKAPLNGPSPEAKRYLVDLPIDYTDGSRRSRGSREGFVEHFRIGADGKIKETQYQLASREAPSTPRKVRPGRHQLASREAPSRPRKAGPDTPSGESTWRSLLRSRDVRITRPR